MPYTVTYLYWTAFPTDWTAIDDALRVAISATADILLSLNYSINFYLYCIGNRDIRLAVKELFHSLFRKLKLIK